MSQGLRAYLSQKLKKKAILCYDKIMSFFRFFFFWRFLFFAIAVQSKFLSAQEACWSQKSRGQHGGVSAQIAKIEPQFEPKFESLFEPKVGKKNDFMLVLKKNNS